ncbi:hypothetical protein EC991_007767, partial [Linnemannia zychae]
MLGMIDKEAGNAAGRITSISNRRRVIARAILNRATDVVNKYRNSRLTALRLELEVRTQHRAVVTRLKAHKKEVRQAKAELARGAQEFTRIAKEE